MKLINLAKINFAGESGSAPVPPGPGPTPTPSADADVVLRDYDGSVVASYSKEEFAALTELPTPPAHEGLTFQEWNWPLADAQAYCAQHGMVEFGATYITSDGKTRIYITLTEGGTNPYMSLGINGSVDVDWGDGSAHDTMVGTDQTTAVTLQHVYAIAGDYIITLTSAEGTHISLLGASTAGCMLLWRNDNSYAPYSRPFQNAIKHLRIGAGIDSIETRGLVGCFSLKTITIPNNLYGIGSTGFGSCFSLKAVSLPRSITYLDVKVFTGCNSLEYVMFPAFLQYIQSGAFDLCYNLKTCILPTSTTLIYSTAFINCFNLSKLVLPEGLKFLYMNAFSNCYSLTEIALPSTLVTGSQQCFIQCYGLKKVIIREGSTMIPSYCFQNCKNLSEIEFVGSQALFIESHAFIGCSNIERVILNRQMRFGPSVFEDLYSLFKVEPGVNYLSQRMFVNCYSLTEITIEESVTNIPQETFANCRNLSRIYCKPIVPPSLSNNAFNNVAADLIIYVPAESVDAYKAATNWVSYASKIQPMP